MEQYVIFISGASSGFGALAAKALCDAGHTVFAGMRGLNGESAKAAAEAEEHAKGARGKIVPVELDVTVDDSVNAAVARAEREGGRLDVLIHNAGHMTFGPLEAFTAEQLLELYNINAVGTQRVNRAALPGLRRRRKGLLLWVGRTSTRGGWSSERQSLGSRRSPAARSTSDAALRCTTDGSSRRGRWQRQRSRAASTTTPIWRLYGWRRPS